MCGEVPDVITHNP